MRKAGVALLCGVCLSLAGCAGELPASRSRHSSSWMPRYDNLARGVFTRPDGTNASAVRFGTTASCFDVYDAVLGVIRRYRFDIIDLVREGRVQDMPADLGFMALRVANRSADGRSTFGEVDVYMLPAAPESCKVSVVRIGTDRMVNPSWEDIAAILQSMVAGRPLD